MNFIANIYNTASNTLLSGTSGDDYIEIDGYNVTVYGFAGNDTIRHNYSTGNNTIIGGKGNDSILLDNYYDLESKYVSIVYTSGNGNDVIEGFDMDDTLIAYYGKSYYKRTSGDDVIVSVDDSNITLRGAAILRYTNVDFRKTEIVDDTEETSWKLDGTTATYGSLTIKGVTSLDGLSLDGKVVTISAASLGTKKISVSDGYTLKLGSDVSSSTTKKSWSLSGTTATYKQTTTAGYSLVDNEIIYSKKTSKTLATVKGVESLDGLSVSGKVVTVSAESLGTSKITISGTGYSLALDDDVSSSTTKKSWTLKNSTATYNQTTTAGYSLVDNEIIYSKKTSKTLATVKGVNDKSGLKVSGKTIKLSGSALSKKVTVSGAYTFDFASDYSKATITGSSSNDTIIARGKNIFVKGGDGSDIFQFKSTGTVSDYEEADKISLTGAANISVSGSDVIFGGKITVAGTGATLTAKYSADEFTPNEYSDFVDMLKTIDASAVDYNLKILGNKRANKITGGGGLVVSG